VESVELLYLVALLVTVIILVTENTIEFLSIICVALQFTVPGKIENFLPEADSHTIKLRWTKPTENGNCVLRYAIEWKALEDGSRNGSGVTENEFYVIGSLEACETYEVSVSAVNENHNTSEADVTNITTLADCK
jgi:hypothetical protein